MNLKILPNLLLNIVKEPTKAFQEVKERRLLFESLFILLIANILSFTLLQTTAKIYHTPLPTIISPQIIISLLIPFLLAFLINFFAVRRYDAKNNYLEILSSIFFIRFIFIVGNLLAIILIGINLIQLVGFLNIVLLIWSLVLDIIAIKTVYTLSTKDSLYVFFNTFLLFGLIFLCGIFFYNFFLLSSP